jgi:hypothetical protein
MLGIDVTGHNNLKDADINKRFYDVDGRKQKNNSNKITRSFLFLIARVSKKLTSQNSRNMNHS